MWSKPKTDKEPENSGNSPVDGSAVPSTEEAKRSVSSSGSQQSEKESPRIVGVLQKDPVLKAEVNPEGILSPDKLKEEVGEVLKTAHYGKRWATADLVYGADVPHIIFSVRDFVLYLIFIATLHIVTFGTPNPAFNHYSSIVSDLLTQSKFESFARRVLVNETFTTIRAMPQIWEYIDDVLMKFLYRTGQKGKNHLDSVLIENVLIGAPALELKRVRNNTCVTAPLFADVFKTCYGYYKDEDEDDQNFGVGSAWEYKRGDAHVVPYRGFGGTYGKGGFHMNFSNDEAFTRRWIQDLKSRAWLRLGARFLSVDFTMYSPSANIFLMTRLVFEILPTGGVVPSSTFHTLKLFRYLSRSDFVTLSCEFIFIIFICYFTFEEIQQHYYLGKKYFSNPWNTLDLTIVVLGYCLIFIGVFRYFVITTSLSSKVKTIHSFDHSDFGYIIYWQQNFDITCSFLNFFALTKLIKFSTLAHSVTLLLNSFVYVRHEVLTMVILTIFITSGFAINGMVLFGSSVSYFADFSQSFFSVFGMNIARTFFYKDCIRYNKYIAPFFFLIYIFFVTLIFMTFFIALLVYGYWQSYEISDVSRRQFFGDFIWAYWIQALTYLGQDEMVRRDWRKKIKQQNRDNYDAFVRILRRRHISKLELKLLMADHEIRRGDQITLDQMVAMYNEFWLRAQLALEAEAHGVILNDLESITNMIDRCSQLIRAIQSKSDILADKIVTS